MVRFAMVFPGQGSQSIGMLGALSEHYSLVEETFSEASNVLNYDLWRLVQEGPVEELNKTWQTQPALLASSVAIYRIWKKEKGAAPAIMAGHSLGEYSALVCAESLSFKDAINLVTLRGRLMQQAVPAGVGGMCAIIGLDSKVIDFACQQAAEGQVVAPVNFNSPGQTVIAGHKEAVLRAAENCKSAGAKRVLLLPVSVPSHCDLMEPIADRFSEELSKVVFFSPKIPVLNNVNVVAEQDPLSIKQALAQQLYRPVRWAEIIESIAKKDITLVIEVGPGRVLANLTRSVVSTLKGVVINEPQSLHEILDLTRV